MFVEGFLLLVGDGILVRIRVVELVHTILEQTSFHQVICKRGSYGEVFAGMGTATLLASFSRMNRLHGIEQKILQFQGFDEIGVPDNTTIFDLK